MIEKLNSIDWTLPNTVLLPNIKESISKKTFNPTLLNRIYVGNLSPEIRKSDLIPIFEKYGIVKAVTLSINYNTRKCKGFGFIELDNPHDASLAITQLNGFEVLGRPLKLNKPLNYPKSLPDDLLKTDKTLIYVSNIHNGVSENDIEKIMRCIGDCKVYLTYGNSYTHLGYGYIKFSHHSLAQESLSINAKLGGKKLRLGPTVIFQEVTMMKKKLNPELENLIREIEKEVLNENTGDNCLILKNLIDFNELDTEFIREIKNEMNRYGSIEFIQVIANKKCNYEIDYVTTNETQFEDINVYVWYKRTTDLETAARLMKNRYFGGRRVQVQTCNKDLPFKEFNKSRIDYNNYFIRQEIYIRKIYMRQILFDKNFNLYLKPSNRAGLL